jgi:zinc protease
MKRSILLSIFILIFLAGTVSLHSGIFPFKAHRKVLDNGLKVIVIPLSNPGLVAYYSVVRTGSRDEYEEGHTGFAHFFEHMMFRGTKKYPGNVYDKLVTEMGANSNAFTTDDLTAYHMVFAKEDLAKVMELESDRFQNLQYKEQEFKTESGAVYGEYLKGKTSPFFILFEALNDTAFDAHTYKHTTMGFEADIKAMPTMYEYSKRFHKRYYRPENVVLLVCGDVVPENVFSMVEKYYGPWEKGYVAPDIQTEPEQTAPRQKKITFKGKTLPILAVAYKGLAFAPKSKDFVASNLLGDIMFGSTSEIYNKLVLKEQKVQFVAADFSINRDPGLNTIFARVKNEDDVDYVRQEIANTIKKFQMELMNKKELDDLKSNLKYGFLMGLSSTARIAGSLPRFIAISGDIECIDQYYETLDTITPEDIREAAKKFLTDNNKTDILLVGEKQ